MHIEDNQLNLRLKRMQGLCRAYFMSTRQHNNFIFLCSIKVIKYIKRKQILRFISRTIKASAYK